MNKEKLQSKELIGCLCTLCGVRNNFKDPNGLCENGHDSWLELRDVQQKNTHFKVAMRAFGRSAAALEQSFLNRDIKQLSILTPTQL
jgi:hypothetical protein